MGRMAWLVALVGCAGAVGCFNKTEDADAASTTSHVNAQGDTSAVLKSTLELETGCVATKVGPKVLVTSARCVVGNAKIVAGASVKFTVAVAASAQGDAGARAPSQSFVVSDVKVHPSFGAKCAGDACAIGKDASDAADIAVVILDQDLETVPALPVDLDAVNVADPLLVVSSGCSALDAEDGAATRTMKTIAVPADSTGHGGSPYGGATATGRLAQSYVVTAGVAWQDKGVHLCSADLGGPVFRGGSAALAGVTSTITVADATAELAPVTVEHTRVDAMSRFKIGQWLASFGAGTIHSCSESAGGCVKRGYDGGMPVEATPPADTPVADDDGGVLDDAGATTSHDGGKKAAPSTEPVTQEQGPSADDYTDDYYADAAVPSKKSKSSAGGCSAAPGSAPSGGLGLGLGLGLALVLAGRRRKA
jgi:hypothetical protein